MQHAHEVDAVSTHVQDVHMHMALTTDLACTLQVLAAPSSLRPLQTLAATLVLNGNN